MRTTITRILPFALALGIGSASAKPLKAYILVGQSNMQGHAEKRMMAGMAAAPVFFDLLDDHELLAQAAAVEAIASMPAEIKAQHIDPLLKAAAALRRPPLEVHLLDPVNSTLVALNGIHLFKTHKGWPQVLMMREWAKYGASLAKLPEAAEINALLQQYNEKNFITEAQKAIKGMAQKGEASPFVRLK